MKHSINNGTDDSSNNNNSSSSSPSGSHSGRSILSWTGVLLIIRYQPDQEDILRSWSDSNISSHGTKQASTAHVYACVMFAYTVAAVAAAHRSGSFLAISEFYLELLPLLRRSTNCKMPAEGKAFVVATW